MQHFLVSHLVTVIGLGLAALWGHLSGMGIIDALVITALLVIMEISLSFDNAVVNATVLKQMDAVWQKRFLTWGILIAVFGMRLVFPIVIVALATGLGIGEVTRLAFEDPHAYSRHVLSAHITIASFGGMFLLMVFLHFIFDHTRHLHWLGELERRLALLGKLESVEIMIALGSLLLLQHFLPQNERPSSLIAGIIGVITYVATKSVTALFGGENTQGAQTMAYAGLTGFIYLQLLDASFSLDGVIGAFAMSKDVIIIMLGLGIGAMFVRSLTVYMVKKGTLDHYVFLEHGAHWGIGALAVIMLISTVTHVSEIITGLIGVTFIGLSFLSSVRYRKRHPLIHA